MRSQERIDIRNYALNVLATKGQQLQACASAALPDTASARRI
jgi:hypothetical protein